jgi:hypothetical protein
MTEFDDNIAACRSPTSESDAFCGVATSSRLANVVRCCGQMKKAQLEATF